MLGDKYARFAGAEAWVAFLSASYLFSHLGFLLGYWLTRSTTRPALHAERAEGAARSLGKPDEDGGAVEVDRLAASPYTVFDKRCRATLL